MEAVYAGVPWALSTMFSLTGAGAFMAMAVLADAFPAEGRRLASIDALSLMPSLAVVLGCVAAYFALQDETAAAFLLRGVDGAARYAAVGAAGAFAVAALAYGAVAVSGRMPSRLRKPLLRTVGLLGLLFVCALAAAHVLAGDPAWATAATPAQMLGCAFLGGSALAALLFENAGALEGRAAKGVLAAFAATGAVLGLGGLAAHVAVVLGAAGIAGVEARARRLDPCRRGGALSGRHARLHADGPPPEGDGLSRRHCRGLRVRRHVLRAPGILCLAGLGVVGTVWRRGRVWR